jgi:DNA-binding XRE family transcriptional regulator
MWRPYNVAVVRQPTDKQLERWRDQGDLIRRMRDARSMSQAALGRALDMSAKTVIQVEKGRRPLDQWEMDVAVQVLAIKGGVAAFLDPPPRSQTVAAPLDPYLAEYVGEVAAEAAAKDRRQRERRTRRAPPSPPP